MMKILKVAGIIILVLILLAFSAGLYVKTALPNTGDPSDIKIERTEARVERGKYLANNVAVCMDCHSSRDWQTFSGPLSGNFGGGGEPFNSEMGFPGNFYAPNITPASLGTWTDGEVLRAVTTGVSKDGHALFPVMGYKRFGKMDEEDVLSIIAYIRTLPPVEHAVPASKADFPVNFLINTMPEKAAFQPRPAKSDNVAYGKYLVNVAGCVDCHSKTDKGQIIDGTEFGGGMEFAQPGGIIRSANITFDNTGIASWTKEAFVKRFKTYTDSTYVPVKLKQGELNTPMPWSMYAGMEQSDLEAIYDFLKSVKPIQHKVERVTN
ncbi:MAG: c-type cytochrome [Chitinophagaceae bacterium]|nr:MAG: c-type cytochrome [Chitinophagaceae bacterium]